MATNKGLDKPEAGTSKGEMVSPLSYQGNQGGNSESPALGKPVPFSPPDPMGVLPKGSK